MHSTLVILMLGFLLLNLVKSGFVRNPEKLLYSNFFGEFSGDDEITADTDKSDISPSMIEGSLSKVERMLLESREGNPKSRSQGQCDKVDMLEILKRDQECHCRPKRHCLEVKQPKYGIVQVMPPCVVVDRCEGFCTFGSGQRCLPRDTEIVSMPVVLIDYGTSGVTPKCSSIEVEKHLTCKCACAVTEEDCNEKQIFNPQRCSCECRNVSEIGKCRRKNKIWNHGTCECDCTEETHQMCSTGALFSLEECRCIPTEGSAEGIIDDVISAGRKIS